MKYFIWVLGCTMNYSDAERIATVMNLLGYKKTEEEKEANIIITVACSVRQTAIDRIYGKTRDWNKKRLKDIKFKTILSGCVLPKDQLKMENSFDLIFDINEIEKLSKFLKPKNDIKGLSGEYLSILPQHKSSFRAFVPIMTGCNNFCSYCAVPYTRGREKSRPQKEVILEVKDLIKRGYTEIHLLGQNVNSYKYNFSELLKKIDSLEGEWRGYFYSNHPKDFSEELLNTISKLNHFPHYIHFPLQSGDDNILKSMNRNYTKKIYLNLINKIRKLMPDVVITTDIIVGYPGENEKEFKQTIEVSIKSKFEMIFIGKYSPRPGAKSIKLLDNVSNLEKKKREKILTKVLEENLIKVNKKFKNKYLRILVDEKKNNKYYGRTEGYKVVEIKTDQELNIGQFYDVLIIDTSAWKLFGELRDI